MLAETKILESLVYNYIISQTFFGGKEKAQGGGEILMNVSNAYSLDNCEFKISPNPQHYISLLYSIFVS